MSSRLVSVLCSFQIMSVFSAPMPWTMQPQYQQLSWLQYQQQMEVLQAMQAQQLQPPMITRWPQPVPIILIPIENDIITFDKEIPSQDLFKRISDKHVFEKERQKVLATSKPQLSEKHDEETDDDSVIVEAESDKKEKLEERVFILVPNNGRFSLGSIIEAIPFLPFEVNVPDSIAWAWNGISSIISGFGQRLPFRPRPMNPVMPVDQMESDNMRLLMKNMEKQNTLNSAMMPMQVFVFPVGVAPAIQPQY